MAEKMVTLLITIKQLVMKDDLTRYPPENLWFTIQFDRPLEGDQRKIYKGFVEGWVLKHDLPDGKGESQHSVDIKWINSTKTAEVYLFPLDKPTGKVIEAKLKMHEDTYSSPATVASDPPVPPAPPPPSGL
jgi:hypothetical protein